MIRRLTISALAAASLSLAAAATTLTVRTTDPRDAPFVPKVQRIWTKASTDLAALGLILPPATLIAHKNAADFARATGRPWTTAAVTTALVIHTQRLSALSSLGSLERTLRHEAFHLAQPPSLPLWLAEGLARHFSGESLTDPRGRTGLENANVATLERALTGSRPLDAYVEATRRSERLLRERGWKALLSQSDDLR